MEGNHSQGITTGTHKQTSAWLYMWHNCLHLIHSHFEVSGKSLDEFSSIQSRLWLRRELQCHCLNVFHERFSEVCTCYTEHLSKLTDKVMSAHGRASASSQRNQQSNSPSTGAGGLLMRICLGPWICSVTYRDKDPSEQQWNTAMKMNSQDSLKVKAQKRILFHEIILIHGRSSQWLPA